MMTPIPPAVQQVLDVYEANLPLVKFGDLEATVLSKAAEEVVLASTALERAEAALETARAALNPESRKQSTGSRSAGSSAARTTAQIGSNGRCAGSLDRRRRAVVTTPASR